MPCRDYYDDHPTEYFRDVTEPALKKQISFAESALCATLDALEKVHANLMNSEGSFYDWADWKEAGVTKQQVMDWRTKHKELDKKHRAEEARKLRESALAKLTPAERKALGVK